MIIITDNAKNIPTKVLHLADLVAEKKPDDSFYLIIKNVSNLFSEHLLVVDELRVGPSYFECAIAKRGDFITVFAENVNNISSPILQQSNLAVELSMFFERFDIVKNRYGQKAKAITKDSLYSALFYFWDTEEEWKAKRNFEDSFGAKVSQAIRWTGDNISEVWSLCPFALLSKEGNIFVPKDAGAKYHSFAVGINITLRKNEWLIKDEFGKFHTARSKE